MPDQQDDTSPVWQFTTVTVTPTPEAKAALREIPALSQLAGPDDEDAAR